MMSTAKLAGSMSQLFLRPVQCLENKSFLHTAVILEAARRGTRAKREALKRAAKKNKVVEVKKEFIPLWKRKELEMGGGLSPRRRHEHLREASDDVHILRYYRFKNLPLSEILAMHRESHHETMLDAPDALVNAHMELDFTLSKKNKFVDNFSGMIKMPHNFDTQQDRTVLVISNKEEIIDYARQAGVSQAVGLEVISMAQDEDIILTDFDYVLADLDLLTELVAIRGLMRRSFPNPKNGTSASDLRPVIDRFLKGVEYKTDRNKYHQDFATLEIPFGRLNQSDEQLEENLNAVMDELESMTKKHKKMSDLITFMGIGSPPTRELFKIDHNRKKEENQSQDDTAEKVTAVAQ